MAFTPEILPIAESDDELRALLSDMACEYPPLLPALAHALGDLSVLPDDLALDPEKLLEEQGGWTPDQLDQCRSYALDALIRLRDHGGVDRPFGPDELHALMRWTTGTDLSGSYVPMLTEELAPDNDDLRAPEWSKAEVAPDRTFPVVIIGAGMSGILAAYRMKQAGIDVVVLEKNAELGGTWLENSYPGCRVDVSNHVYAYSFMQKHDWPQFHSSRDVLLEYFNDCADAFDVRDLIHFNTEVSSAVWDDEAHTWTLEVITPEGEATMAANAIVSAVGQLNRPSFPDIEGRESYAGETWHSARWNHDVDLTGKSVAVIGTGCSAMQFIPRVAEQAAHTTVFQRTPNWLTPRPQYQQPLPDTLMWLFTHIPHYSNWFRLRQFWRSHEGLLPRCEVDPEWIDPGDKSVSAINHELGTMLRMYIEMEFADRPDLLEQVMPNYPIGSKRFVVDDGLWAKTLKRDDVDLCTTTIERITQTGVRTADGVDHDVDVLLYGTGFQASKFLTPMKVVGRGGVDLHDQWDGDARAYLGVVSPNFPNFFYLYGPNTNIVINGSIIYFSECEVHYIVQCLRYVLDTGIDAIDVVPEVHDRYNEWIDEGNLKMAWGVSDVSSWYKAASGRVAQNWPYSMLEFWEQTREVNPADYETIG